MEQYQPHNSIDPSLPAPPPPFFSTTAPSASSAAPPLLQDLSPVVNFSPPQPPLPNQTSYDVMIMGAISALGEKDGSSRQAIARYIERVYNNLPSNHSFLLTNHLKKLKNSGQLIMVKHSYLLPNSGSNPNPIPIPIPNPNLNPYPNPNPPYYTTTLTTPSYTFSPPYQVFTTTSTSESAPPFSATTTEAVLVAPPPAQPKKRGRPPKAKPDLAQNLAPAQAQFQNYGHVNGPGQAHFQNFVHVNGPGQAQLQNQGVDNGPEGAESVVSVKRRPGRPRKEKPIEAQYSLPSVEAQNGSLPPVENSVGSDQVGGAGTGVGPCNGAVSGSEAMLVSLGLSDGPSPGKMRPRRSQKPAVTAELPPGAVAQNGGKKRPGRPRKVNSAVGGVPAPGVYPVQVPVGTSPPPSNASNPTGRVRGRPRKYAVAPGAPLVNGGVNGVQQPKKRGRKPKNANNAAAFAVPVSFMLPEQMNAGGVAMMPQANFVQAGGDASGGVVPGQVPVTGVYNGVVYPPMKRGRGRPPRTDGGLASGALKKARRLSGKPLGRPRKNQANSEDQSFEIVYLKSKLSYFQSKIKESVPIIKAYLNGEEANAMGALGQLEGLATEDFDAALKTQNQQQPPAQHLQTEQQ